MVRGRPWWTRFRSDGTRKGTRFLVAFREPETSGDDTPLHGATDPALRGDRIMFLVHHLLPTGHGYRRIAAALWETDGTARGTRRVVAVDLGPRIDLSQETSEEEPSRLAVVGRRAFLAARDDRHGMELWSSDGSAGGTRIVADVRPGPRESAPRQLVKAFGRLTFTADDGVHGRELWITGGRRGTRLVADVRPGPAGSAPSRLVVIGDVAFFSADDGSHGRELWVTDGTRRGTRLVRDIMAGRGASSPALLTRVGRTLFFVATDEAGAELWRSDGTATGTLRVADLRAGRAGSYPTLLTAVRGSLFFTADDGVHGREPWRLAP